VTSRATPRFWAAYRELPHPSLQFKKVHDREPIYSVRVSLGCRALGFLDDEEIAWFWIGTHAEYDRLLETL
jgi:hypothetical protein